MESVSVKRRSKSGSSCHPSPHICGKSGLSILSNDHVTKVNLRRTRCCRTIILQKSKTGSYGFTLQTYAFKNYKTNRAELLTYVDYVEVGGPAFRAGMKRGDVILCINDSGIEHLKHEHLVELIRRSPNPMRLTVTFEDWCKRIDLNVKKLKLKQRLKEKYLELAMLEKEEKGLLQKRGLWVEADNLCSSEPSSELPSPPCSRRTSFMSNSLNVLDVELFSDPTNFIHETNDLSRKYSNLLRPRKSENSPSKGYECHSLPIVRKKKHSLQNQVFSVCENVVRMGCFSKSSVDIDGSVDDLALVGDDSLTSDCECGDATSGRIRNLEQNKVWYGVPKMYRAALLKSQRKMGEGTKWYFSVFDDDSTGTGPSESIPSVDRSDSVENASDSRLQADASLLSPACPDQTSDRVLTACNILTTRSGSTTYEGHPGSREEFSTESDERIRSSSDSNVGECLSNYGRTFREMNSVSQEFLSLLPGIDTNNKTDRGANEGKSLNGTVHDDDCNTCL